MCLRSTPPQALPPHRPNPHASCLKSVGKCLTQTDDLNASLPGTIKVFPAAGLFYALIKQPLVSVGGRFQDLPQIPQSENALAHCQSSIPTVSAPSVLGWICCLGIWGHGGPAVSNPSPGSPAMT